MESTNDEVPAERGRNEGHEKTQIANETMLQVLLWLDRFDLDGKQITTRLLRALVEDNRMPLRKVDQVDYAGEVLSPTDTTLFIYPEESKEVVLPIETDTDAQKAASYLSSCFVRYFIVQGHTEASPKNGIIAAPALISDLEFQYCDFYNGKGNTLSETLNGSTFQSLAIDSLPVRQIDDNLLESLRARGCNEIRVNLDIEEPHDVDEKFKLTEEGLLSYCFTLDGGLAAPQSRILQLSWATISPAFFRKIVEASKKSQLTCDVELCLGDLQFDVDNLDVGVLPSHSQEYDGQARADVSHVRYNIADHGNGIRLLIHFQSAGDGEWDVNVRHGKKDYAEFFEPTPDDEEHDEESSEDES